MSFNVILKQNKSEKNRVVKDLTTIATLTGDLRAETSIIDPVILISASMSNVKTANYLEISEFGRKYFITNIRSVRDGVIEISAHVDVLSTYATQLLMNKAIISRSENDWNLYLNDGSLKAYQDSQIFTKYFPHGFEDQTFVLVLAGS